MIAYSNSARGCVWLAAYLLCCFAGLLISVSDFFCILMHFRTTHAFFSLPGPPYLGLSRQYLQDKQFEEVQPAHSPHLTRF